MEWLWACQSKKDTHLNEPNGCHECISCELNVNDGLVHYSGEIIAAVNAFT